MDQERIPRGVAIEDLSPKKGLLMRRDYVQMQVADSADHLQDDALHSMKKASRGAPSKLVPAKMPTTSRAVPSIVTPESGLGLTEAWPEITVVVSKASKHSIR